jgi:fumarate reductase subunit C
LVAALGIMGWLVPHDAWRTLALVSAVISLVALALFWNAFVSFIPNKVGAIGVNVATLVCLLALNWPTEADLGF